ncbi:MAG: hypothetical protein FWD96_06060, partial [Defluviitaleaceae bacterium]|nr:hypothetical protein [Defluviitaleaceae bacterium]
SRPRGGGFWGGFGWGFGMSRMFSPRRRTHVHHHHHGGGPGGSGGGGGCGCGSIAILILVLVLITLVISLISGNLGGSQVTPSTVRREPLPAGSAIEGSYLTDHLGWIRSTTVLETGMRNFYQRTGVHPHLYITDTVDGSNFPTSAQMQAYAEALYDRLFNGEAHLVLLFHEYEGRPEQNQTWLAIGVQARTVIDTEAANILLDYIDRHYFSNMDEDTFFSRAFDDASRRIMTVTTSPWVYIAGGLVALLFLAIVFIWWMRAKAQKNLEAEQAREILSMPLQEFGSRDSDTGLEDKYRD